MTNRILVPDFVFLTTEGNPDVGAVVNFFEVGTSTPKVTYADSALTTPNPANLATDGDGRLLVSVWGDGAFKMTVTPSVGSVRTYENVNLVIEDALVESLRQSLTISLAIALSDIQLGEVFLIKDTFNAFFDVVLTSGVTPNGRTIFQSTAIPTLSFEMRRAGKLIGKDGKRYQVISGVLQNSGSGWGFIEDSNHSAVGFSPIVTVVDGFRLSITNTVSDPTAKVVSLLVTPDEGYQLQAGNVGASVGVSNSRVQCSFPLRFYFVGATIAGNTEAHINNVTILNQNGRLEISHPIIGGDNGVRGPARTVTTRWNSTAQHELQADHITSVLTYVYEIAPLTAEVSFNGSTWDVVSEDFITPITAAFAASTLTITHDDVDLLDIPIVCPADGSAIIPIIKSRTTTTTAIQFRDYTGATVTSASTEMKISLGRGKARINPENASGFFHADQAVAYWDDMVSTSANFWVTGLVELNE